MSAARRTTATGVLLTMASARSFTAATRALAAYRISPRAFAVLELTQEQSRGQRELAALLELDPSRIVSLVDTLESVGFVERRTSAGDRRARVVVVTASGAQAYPRIRREVDDAVDAALARLTRQERATLDDLLRRVVDGTSMRHESGRSGGGRASTDQGPARPSST